MAQQYFIDPASIAGYQQFLPSSYYNAATPTKGSDEPKWEPYSKDGYYYSTENSWPIEDRYIPGASYGASHSYRKTANQIRAYQDLMPYYIDAIGQNAPAAAQIGVDVAKQTSPQYAELMLQLYNTYGPALNQIGNKVADINAQAQAQRDLNVMQGTGKDLLAETLAQSKMVDPEFYATRATTADSIAKLLASIDPTGKLTGTERDEIAQGAARDAAARGTLFAPSQTDIIANAMRYGKAASEKASLNQSTLANAINSASNFLPNSKTGFDPFQIATGRSATSNSGESKFTGVSSSNPIMDLSSSMFGNMTSLTNNSSTNQTQKEIAQMNIDANKKDWLDKFSQFSSAAGSMTSSMGNIGMMAGMCWVAREVYGANNPNWLKFRNWLLCDAPVWFRELYRENGERFAKFISNKPLLKFIIKKWMDARIK